MVLNELANHFGTDKRIGVHGYTKVYESLLPDRLSSLHILEIGIATGASIRMWSEYIPYGTVTAVDIDRQAVSNVAKIRNVIAVGADASKADLWNSLSDNHFDLVIDDGSHEPRECIAMLKMGIKKVKPGGYYTIEDLHYGYQIGDYSLMNYIHDLITNQQMRGYGYGDFYRAIEADPTTESMTKEIYGISMYKSLVVIQRA